MSNRKMITGLDVCYFHTQYVGLHWIKFSSLGQLSTSLHPSHIPSNHCVQTVTAVTSDHIQGQDIQYVVGGRQYEEGSSLLKGS